MSRFKTVGLSWFFITPLLMVGCIPSGDKASDMANISSAPSLESFAAKPATFRVSLTDAPSKDLKSVFVNVHSLELWLEKGGKEARLILGKNIGVIDLMTLRDGVLLPVSDFTMPEGVNVKQIRLVLNGTGNYAIKGDDSTCSLQTPSAQQSGIKIKLSQTVLVENGFSYSLVVDFDAEKSVVVKGNGDCLLKPVLKVGGFTRLPSDDVDPDGGNETPGEDVTGGNQDSNTGGDSTGGTGSGDGSTDSGSGDGSSDGFDPGDPSTWPPGYDAPDEIIF